MSIPSQNLTTTPHAGGASMMCPGNDCGEVKSKEIQSPSLTPAAGEEVTSKTNIAADLTIPGEAPVQMPKGPVVSPKATAIKTNSPAAARMAAMSKANKTQNDKKAKLAAYTALAKAVAKQYPTANGKPISAKAAERLAQKLMALADGQDAKTSSPALADALFAELDKTFKPSNDPKGASAVHSPEKKSAVDEIAQERNREAHAILDNPALSVQDKVFLLVMLWATSADREKEEQLKELTAAREARDNWKRLHDEMTGSAAVLQGELTRMTESKAQAEETLSKAKTPKEKAEATEALKNINDDLQSISGRLTELEQKISAGDKEAAAIEGDDILTMKIKRTETRRQQMIELGQYLESSAKQTMQSLLRG